MPNLCVDPENQLNMALNALDAVRDLCCEAANGQQHPYLNHVNSDHFASLLGLIVDEMRSALAAADAARA